ncbi:MAG: acyl-CoA dehydrogenase [Bacteroidota bacterium]
MAQYVSLDNLRFMLHELLQAEQLCDLPRFKDYDKESFDLLLDSTKAAADQHMYPVYKEMDARPARFEDGKIIVHPAVGNIMKHAGENGSIGSTFDYEAGGMQLPTTIRSCVAHIANAANNHIVGYPGLTSGAAKLIVHFADQSLTDRFVPNMMKGKWGGTMCLTEPQAGSSLADITTSASPNEDGSYQIKGQKIFISGGDHEYVENIVHLLLAKIDGAPEGTKGISLFVVPKKRKTKSGALESNDVITAGDFQKMGQRGFCTAHLVFGENDNCRGWLVGEPHRGLKYMFQMMNDARIDVGMLGASIATAAYYASLQYAKERPQGRRVGQEGAMQGLGEQTTIINHPDVRRMLLLQRAIIEGSLALLLQVSMHQDMAHYGPEEERERNRNLLELLTPIAKTYPAEMGRESINNGLQVLGGYGFCTDFPLELYYRDIRIMSLYEGTTGIQSMDLMGRKIVMKNGDAMRQLFTEIKNSISEAKNYDDLKPYAEQLKNASKEMQATLMHLLGFAMQGEHERYISDATVFMEYMSTVVIAWQWLNMATAAKTALITGKGKFADSFYENKIFTMRFYFKYELPKTLALKDTLIHPEVLTMVKKGEKIFA